MSDTAVATVTALLATFDCRYTDTHVARARDMLLRGEALYVGGEAEASRTVSAVFPTAADATRAAVQMARTLVPEPGDTPLSGMRLVLDTVPASPHPADGHDSAGGPLERLLSCARPGEILTTATTAAVAGPTLPPSTDLLDRGAWTPAPDRPMERLYELRVDGAGGAAHTSSNLEWARRALAGQPGDGDGRAGPLDAEPLAGTWRPGAGGNLRVVLLTGGSNPGTHAASAHLALRAHAEGALVLYGRWDREHRAPYQAYREALAVYADRCDDDVLRQDLKGRAETIGRLFPDVAARVGVAVRPSRRGVDGRSTGDSHGGFADAVVGWLAQVTARVPTLLVLHDLQWGDLSSVRLLAHLWHARRRSPLLVLLTAWEPDERRSAAVEALLAESAQVDVGLFDHVAL